MLNVAIKSVTHMTSAFDSQGSGFGTRHTVCLTRHVTFIDLWTFDFDYSIQAIQATQASVPPNLTCTFKIFTILLMHELRWLRQWWAHLWESHLYVHLLNCENHLKVEWNANCITCMYAGETKHKHTISMHTYLDVVPVFWFQSLSFSSLACPDSAFVPPLDTASTLLLLPSWHRCNAWVCALIVMVPFQVCWSARDLPWQNQIVKATQVC